MKTEDFHNTFRHDFMNLRHLLSTLIATASLAALLSATVAYADTATHTYDANGRLWQVIGPNWTTTYTYDNAGNVTNVARTTTQFSLMSVVSRKAHGAAGNLDMPIDSSIAVTGNVTVESRYIGSGHKIVFRFNSPVTNPGTSIAYDKLGSQIGSTTTTASGSEVTVLLTGTLNTKRVRIDLSGVNGAATVYQVAMGFLYGDVDNDRLVGAGDIAVVRGRSGQPANGANFLSDLDASGGINGSDVSIVRGQSGQALEL